MAEISEIDKNLKVVSSLGKENIALYDVNEKPFSLFGVFFDGKGFVRMDTSVAEKTSVGVHLLNRNTSGGRVTFETDSKYVSVFHKGDITYFSHMALTGTAGFDLYIFEDDKFRYYRSFVPPIDKTNGYESIVKFDDKKMRKILIHFPLYSNVDSLHIGIEENSVLNEFNPYKKTLPIVYYGSSITQGGGASRPGNNYPAIISQKNLIDFICLGFSGNAHGEDIMADYISNIPMSAFVLDYDHNDIDNPERLKEKHYAFYKKVREKNKAIPIIIMSAPYTLSLSPMLDITKKIVKENFNKISQNDRNVYFIDGEEMLGKEFFECATVDGCHPNDFGFVKMAKAVSDILNTQNSLK